MLVKQISIFVENKSGRLAEITRILAENNIDISALSIADTTDFGILRLIVNKPGEAEEVLKENGLAVRCTEVIGISVEDKPGGLAKVLEILQQNGVGIEYMYAFVGKISNAALVIIRADNADLAVETLQKNNISLVTSDTVYKL